MIRHETKNLMEISGKDMDAKESAIRIGAIWFDPGTGELRDGQNTRRLEPRAACVLLTLARQKGATFPRPELLDRCWGEGDGSDEALTQAISQIRKAFADFGENASMIETLPKRGYRLQQDFRKTPPETGGVEISSRRVRRWIFAGLITLFIAILAAWIAFPHGMVHLFRHSLGMHPQAGSEAHSNPGAKD